MGKPAARVTDMTVCPGVAPGPVPHVGGPIIPPCCPTVLTCGMPQARVTDQALCNPGIPAAIISGAWTVLVCGQPAARIGDMTSHGGRIITGCPTVLIGGGGGGGAAPVPGAALEDAAQNVNPSGSFENCGNIIDAVAARLNGTDPNAVAPAEEDGTFEEIEDRFGTDIDWGSDFQSAFDAVENGGHGTMAIVGVEYSDGASHVVIMANDHGTVGIVEGQGDDAAPPEVVTDAGRANELYNDDGGSDIGWGIVGSRD